MHITIKINSYLLNYTANQAEIGRDVLPDTTVQDIITDFKFPEGLNLLMLVNGLLQTPDYVFKNNDTLALFPPIGGG